MREVSVQAKVTRSEDIKMVLKRPIPCSTPCFLRYPRPSGYGSKERTTENNRANFEKRMDLGHRGILGDKHHGSQATPMKALVGLLERLTGMLHDWHCSPGV